MVVVAEKMAVSYYSAHQMVLDADAVVEEDAFDSEETSVVPDVTTGAYSFVMIDLKQWRNYMEVAAVDNLAVVGAESAAEKDTSVVLD